MDHLHRKLKLQCINKEGTTKWWNWYLQVDCDNCAVLEVISHVLNVYEYPTCITFNLNCIKIACSLVLRSRTFTYGPPGPVLRQGLQGIIWKIYKVMDCKTPYYLLCICRGSVFLFLQHSFWDSDNFAVKEYECNHMHQIVHHEFKHCIHLRSNFCIFSFDNPSCYTWVSFHANIQNTWILAIGISKEISLENIKTQIAFH